MEPSDEICQAMLEMARAWAERDDAAWHDLWSSRSGVVSFGSDPREVWVGYDAVQGSFNAVSAALREQGDPVRLSRGEVFAFQEGSVGWGLQSATLEFGGVIHTFRLTGVFHLERGRWKLVHCHRSIGVFDDDLIGFGLTPVLESVTEAVQRERPDLSTATAPNGTVTILFTDIEGSSALTERLGDEVWMTLLREHNAGVRRQAGLHSGYEVKSQGDGFMFAFASARDALRCAIGVQRSIDELARPDAQLRVRIGVHTGEVVREADDFYGKAVIKAARIASQARGSEILTSALVRDLVDGSGEFVLEGPRSVELRGLAGVHDLWTLRWEESAGGS